MKMTNISPCSGSLLLSQHLQSLSKSPLMPLQVQFILQKRRPGQKLTDWWSRKKPLRTLKLPKIMDCLMQIRIIRWKTGTICWSLQSRRMLEEMFPQCTHVPCVAKPRRRPLATESRSILKANTSGGFSLIAAPVYSAQRFSSPRVSWEGIPRKHTGVDCGSLKYSQSTPT